MELLDVFDSEAIARKVETMAARGWMAERIGTYFWHYRRCEPQTLHAAVQYFPKASDFDPGPSEAERRMLDYAARDGWQPLLRWGQAQVLVNTALEPLPLQTDAVAQVTTLRRALLRSLPPSQLVLLLIVGWYIFFILSSFRRDALVFLSSTLDLALVGLLVLLLTVTAATLARLGGWLRRAQAAAQAGVFLPLRSARRFNIVMVVLALLLAAWGFGGQARALPFGLMWLALYLLALRAGFALKDHLKAAGASAGFNRFATMALSVVLMLAGVAGVVWITIRLPLMGNGGHVRVTYPLNGRPYETYADPLPLTMEDLAGAPAGELHSHWLERSASPLLAVTEYRDWAVTGPAMLEYTVYAPRWPGLYEFCRQQLLAAHSTQDPASDELADYWFAVDAAPWGAEEVWQRWWSSGPQSDYLVCLEGRIAEVWLETEPTPEQAALIAERLQNG